MLINKVILKLMLHIFYFH